MSARPGPLPRRAAGAALAASEPCRRATGTPSMPLPCRAWHLAVTFTTKEVEMTSPLRRLAAALACGSALVACVGVLGAAGQGTGTIRGEVVDATTGRPVDGAHVYLVGTDIGTLTSADGRYQLNVRAGEIVLRTRRVGYGSVARKVTVTAGQIAQADFALAQAVIGLDAVVVTGAGAQTEKRKLGNTISTIDAGTLRNASVTNLSEQLAARDPAVAVLPSGGLVGEGARIRIRRTTSLTQANEPVVYVDGVRIDRSGGFGDNGGAGGGGTPSPRDDINPEAGGPMEDPKRAAPATLYGRRTSAGLPPVLPQNRFAGPARAGLLSSPG